MEVVILTGRSILLAGASYDDTLEVIVMKAELAALCAFKATTPPAVTTGAAHTGKRARVQHRLPKLRASGELSAPSAPSNSGEKVRELSVSNKVGSMIDDMLGGEQQAASSKLMLQDYKKFKHGKEVPQEAEIQYLKPHLLAQALVHHMAIMGLPPVSTM